jgi:hypothetical protein
MEEETAAEETNKIWRDFVITAAELCVHLGLMNSVMEQYPPHVRENFNERMTDLRERMEDEILAVQSFGEAFDEE